MAAPGPEARVPEQVGARFGRATSRIGTLVPVLAERPGRVASSIAISIGASACMTLDAQALEPSSTQLRQGIALALSCGGYRRSLFQRRRCSCASDRHSAVCMRRSRAFRAFRAGSSSATYLCLIWKRLTWQDGVATNLRRSTSRTILNFSRHSDRLCLRRRRHIHPGSSRHPASVVAVRQGPVPRCRATGSAGQLRGPRFLICAADCTTELAVALFAALHGGLRAGEFMQS